MAIRILTAGYAMPAFTANKMEKYCENVVAALKDVTTAETTIQNAVQVVDIATAGNYDRDNIRSETFTENVIKTAKTEHDNVSATGRVAHL